MSSNLYPLQFTPILKERIWGGDKLHNDLRKPVSDGIIGESWELSGVEGDVSTVANGEFAGQSLNSLLETFGARILGESVFEKFGSVFPLLFKFIDAKQDLSIQVHPGDELARERHNSFGKTEMWYVVSADPGSRIIVGFRKKSSADEYIQALESKTLPELLDSVECHAGDVFFLATGTIHAIGGGILIAEIQQTSDITYRVYDWDRVDKDGKGRELHTDEALAAINYDVVSARRTYQKIPNWSNSVVNCPYFTTNFIPLDGEMPLRKRPGSFSVLMCVSGHAQLVYEQSDYELPMGQTVLIPAELAGLQLKGKAGLLEIYIS